MPETTGTIQGTASINRWGGVYESGRSYTLGDKFRVSTVYEKHRARAFPMGPSISKVAKEAQVSRRFMPKVLRELKDGGLVDVTKSKATGVCGFLDIEHELFLLGLRAENPARSNQDYCNNLLEGFGVAISPSSISNFFSKRFDHAGKFKKAILISSTRHIQGRKSSEVFRIHVEGQKTAGPYQVGVL
jgi:transposase